jgi:hypothetical protein
MHERQNALTSAILVLTLLAAAPARAERDAATKAQEGEINQWIDYYRKNRQQPGTPAPQGAAEKDAQPEKIGIEEIRKP